MPSAQDIADIEAATLAAVPPEETEAFADWLLCYDKGTVGRAHSAVPLRHEPQPAQVVDEIAARYAARGLTPMLRLARIDAFAPLRAALQERGWHGGKPTAVELARCEQVADHAGDLHVQFTAAPTQRWADVFLGEGFDPVDGASRLDVLGRARSSVFATVTDDERVVAVGSACFSHGWCGIHGMRTTPSHRGRGYARGIIAAFAREALGRGIARAYLQVEEGNARARSIYAKAGFREAWVYEYWQPAT